MFEGYPKESDVAQLNGDNFVLIIELSKGNDLGEVVKQIRSSDTWNIFTAIYCTEKKWDSARVYETLRVRRTDIYYSHFKSVESTVRQLLDTNTEPFKYHPQYLQEGVPNWPFSCLLSGHTFLPPVAIAISTALYSGLHAAAWHSFFPTEVEKWFWRVSSIIIAGSGLLFACAMAARSLLGKTHPVRVSVFCTGARANT
jgi:hypothetical protein